jgi:cytochrome c biogenesis protein CcmG, thiol:disulfide interchange protein DsbE
MGVVGRSLDRSRPWLALAAAVLVALLAGWLLLGGGLQQLLRTFVPPPAGEVGQPAPDFTLERPDQASLRLADYRGSVVLLNFWATWCTPCRAEMPEIEQVYQANRARGFQVLAVNLQEGAAEVQPFMSELGLSFPALLDRDGTVSRLYRARALPSSFLIDRSGTVQYIRIGTLTRSALEEQLQKAGL